MITKPLCLVLFTAFVFAIPVAARTPTNDAAAFKTFHLYNDRSASANTIDHLNFASYPSNLASPPLLMVMRPTPGSADTMALFNSFAKDATYFEVNGTATQSFATYTVSSPQFASSLGSLLMGVNIYAGTGGFADGGKQLATATVTYADGDTTIARLNVGTFVRDYFDSGALTCGINNYPLYTARPIDSRSAFLYETGGDYFDAQEYALPKTKRAKRVVSVRFDGTLLSHLCGPVQVTSGSRFSGFSIWPNFTVVNASSQPVARVSQSSGQDHGGYQIGTTVYGTRRKTDVTACEVAAMAMCYTYAGVPTTLLQLNAYLQQNKGYEPDQVAILTFVSPTGDAIRYTGTGLTKLNVGDKFLVETRTPYTTPLATYQVTVAYQAKTNTKPFIAGQASRFGPPHSATIPTTTDVGRVYWKIIPHVADGFTGNTLRSNDLYDSPQLAAQVESLLVRDIPVQVNVHPTSVSGHFVVASGWTSSFRPDGSARGTYSISDPYDPRDFTKLIEARILPTSHGPQLFNYGNSFTMARYVVPVPLPLVAAVASNPPGLAILASGARRVEVIDPLGRHMFRDASTDEGVYEIPDGSIVDVASEHDNDTDADGSLTGYDIEIPTTVDGHYIVHVYSNDGLAMSVNGYSSAGVFATDDVADTIAAPVGNTYDVIYSGGGQTVSVTLTGTIGVSSIPTPVSHLSVRQSPTTGPVVFVLGGITTTRDAIDVFDITGRRVDALQLVAGDGSRAATWDWRSTGIRPGVYLARLSSHPSELTRFVLLH